MASYKVSPTRSNLLRLKKQIDFAREGYELLEQKREVLISEVFHLIGSAENIREELQQVLEEAFEALKQANIVMGMTPVRRVSYASGAEAKVSIKENSVMGVVIPEIEVCFKDYPLDYSLFGTCAALDIARNAFKRALAKVIEMAEIYTSLSRLAEEAKKTQIRVNALENVFIPQYSHAIRYIEETLEEREREEMYARKLSKGRLDALPEG